MQLKNEGRSNDIKIWRQRSIGKKYRNNGGDCKWNILHWRTFGLSQKYTQMSNLSAQSILIFSYKTHKRCDKSHRCRGGRGGLGIAISMCLSPLLIKFLPSFLSCIFILETKTCCCWLYWTLVLIVFWFSLKADKLCRPVSIELSCRPMSNELLSIDSIPVAVEQNTKINSSDYFFEFFV